MLRPRRENPKTNSLNRFVYYFSLLMTLFYVGLGIFIIFFGDTYLNLNIPENFRIVLGGVLILYGIIRFIRTSRKKTRSDDDTL